MTNSVTGLEQQAANESPDDAAARAIAAEIRANNRILILTHLRPDGDCLGTGLALWQALLDMGKSPRIFTLGPIPGNLHFLHGFDRLETTFPNDDFDLVISVDTSDPDRVFPGFIPPPNLLNIDHHITNTRFGKWNLVDAGAGSAAEIMYRLLFDMNIPLTPPIATALYTGIMTDTGGFRYSNTRASTFDAACQLVERGASPSAIAEAVFETRKPAAMRLMGLVFASLHLEFDGRFAWNQLSKETFADAGATEMDSEGLSSEMRTIEGVEISVLFTETALGECRCGFRSRGKVDVAALAARFGGGGHHNASGATIRKPFAQATDHAVTVIRAFLSELWSK